MVDFENKEYMEYGLPKLLELSIQKYKNGLKLLEDGVDYTLWDCDYCELQSNINIAEVENMISSDQAWYLREKYLGIKKE